MCVRQHRRHRHEARQDQKHSDHSPHAIRQSSGSVCRRRYLAGRLHSMCRKIKALSSQPWRGCCEVRVRESQDCLRIGVEAKMHSHIIWLVGQRFGHLVVQELSHVDALDRRAWWNCICDCGVVKPIRSNSLRSGATTSCGCALEAYRHRNQKQQ